MQNNWNTQNKKILSLGLTLTSIGINNWGLTKEECLEAIASFKRASIPILGGDVMKLENGSWVHTLDNWYCNRLLGESNDRFVVRSIQLASQFVNNYSGKQNSNILFVLLPKD
jgi:Immunity protein 40